MQKNLVSEASQNNYGNEVEKSKTPEIPKPTIGLKNLSSVSFSQNISINKKVTQTKQEEEVTLQELTNRPTEPFTIEEFQKKWFAYKNRLVENGSTSMATAFENLPEINGETITITIENKALEDDINETKTDILDFLRKELNNYNITLNTKINADLKARKAYTPMEKFAKMSEKNPHLITLVKTFDMDINYPNK